MNDYGLKIQNTKGKVYYIYFKPMCYRDWSYYINNNNKLEISNIRFICKKYITKIFTILDDGKYKEEAIDYIVLHEDEHLLLTVANKIVEKSEFDTAEYNHPLCKNYQSYFQTVHGLYDSFLYIHLNLEEYEKIINSDINTRLYYIALLERIKNINTQERINDSINYNIPLNIVDEDQRYNDWKRKTVRHTQVTNNNRAHQDAQKPQHVKTGEKIQKVDDNTYVFDPTDDLSIILENAKIALNQTLKQNNNRVFKIDFAQDEKGYENC